MLKQVSGGGVTVEGTRVETSMFLLVGFLNWLKEEIQWGHKLHSSYVEDTVSWVCAGEVL